MKTLHVLVLVAVTAFVAGSTPASVITLATNVDFSQAPYTFGVTPDDTFTFTYSPQGSFEPSPVLIRTTGNADVTAVFGQPSVSFPRANAVFGPDAFPGFAAIPVDTRAPYTLTSSDLGLRYGEQGTYHYGYARFAGSLIERIAFESVANAPITAGALGDVPEPESWAMMIMGFGLVGIALRRVRRCAVQFS